MTKTARRREEGSCVADAASGGCGATAGPGVSASIRVRLPGCKVPPGVRALAARRSQSRRLALQGFAQLAQTVTRSHAHDATQERDDEPSKPPPLIAADHAPIDMLIAA